MVFTMSTRVWRWKLPIIRNTQNFGTTFCVLTYASSDMLPNICTKYWYILNTEARSVLIYTELSPNSQNTMVSYYLSPKLGRTKTDIKKWLNIWSSSEKFLMSIFGQVMTKYCTSLILTRTIQSVRSDIRVVQWFLSKTFEGTQKHYK